MYDECTELLEALLKAEGPGGSLLSPGLRDRALLCQALIEEGREEAAAHARYATLGRLAAAVLHELLNPLAYVQTNLEVFSGHLPAVLAGAAARDPQLAEEVKSIVDDSRKGVERISTALSALRILLREEPPGASRGDVRRAADAAARLLAMRLPPGVRLEQKLTDVPAVACGDGMVGQVLLQLLLRSLQALPESGGQIVLRCHSTPPDWVVVEVEHGGGGVGELDQLAFSLAQHLVERAGGHLERLSRPGGGALYAVQLPVAQ